MGDVLKSYFDIIVQERAWSWTLIGIVYLVAASLIRSWFLAPMKKSAHDLKTKYLQEVKHAYLKKSLSGWVFFFLPMGGFIYVWMTFSSLPLTGFEVAVLAAGAVSFLASLVLHMQAFSGAAVSVLTALVNELEKEGHLK